jgi:hypothetical protein
MGVEIAEDAQPIQAHPFSGPTAFMLGNEVPRTQYVHPCICTKAVIFGSASALSECMRDAFPACI